MADLKKLIREVPDFPKPGILFYDITTLLKDPAGLRGVIDGLKDHYRDAKVDVVLGIEARGFIFAPALAYALGAGFVPVRKPKKLPAETVSVTYDLEYGTDTLEMHKDAVSNGARVLIVDDLLATGGTAAAAARMVEAAGGAGGRRGIRGRADVPQRARASWLAARSSRCSSTTNERHPPGARARAGQNQSRVARAWASGRTATTNCAPSSRRFLWPIRSRSLSRRRAGPPSSWWTISISPITWSCARPALAMDAMRVTGRVEMRLKKRIPMGAGLGGGSSDAAAVLLALPVLAGRSSADGSLVPTGRAVGQRRAFLPAGRRRGRAWPRHGTVSAARWQATAAAFWCSPGIHISTAEAYRRLIRV